MNISTLWSVTSLAKNKKLKNLGKAKRKIGM